MSVVNRMLQDIDRRLADARADTRAPDNDIRSVPALAPAKANRVAVLAAVILGVTGIAAAWSLLRDRGGGASAPIAIASVAAPKPAPSAASRVVAPAAAMPIAPSSALPAQSRPSTSAPAAAVVRADPAVPSEPSAAARPEAGDGDSRSNVSLKLSALLAEVPSRIAEAPPRRRTQATTPIPASGGAQGASASRAIPAAPAKVEVAHAPGVSPARSQPVSRPTTTVSVKELPVRQVAPDETIAAARSLWSDGAQGAAIATLSEAMAMAQATHDATATADLALELARFDIADNRVQAALDLLKSQEGALASDAEAWALRGNAQQRLALHREAAASYLAALRLKPGQGKWMLGAAISLAAEGRRDEARTWVERARERSAITPAIGAYLQQLGLEAR